MKLTDVKGVGQSAAGKLAAAGIRTVDELADIDLRSLDVTGLSAENVAKMRDNARKLLEAQATGDLTLVKGLGGSAKRKLQKAGVETIEDLVELDLRSETVEGLSVENLQKLKHRARYLIPEG